MSREGIREELEERKIQIQELVYSQLNVSVYRGHFAFYPSAIKIQAVNSATDYYRYETEFNTLLRLSHPNIIKLYDCFWLEKAGKTFVVIVSEWCAKDLAKDAEQRKQHMFAWTEGELWEVLRKLVSTLSYMQQQNYTHRDIKPHNIFFSNKEVKLGDFGSAMFREDYSNYKSTVIGTLQYFSPILRQSFAVNQFKVVHNPYKSDVFSLGLTMLHLALLDYPNVFLNCKVTRMAAWSVVQCIRYSEGLKRTIMWMVEPEESARCDFEMLDSYLNLTELPAEILEAEEELAHSLEVEKYPTQVEAIAVPRSTESSESEPKLCCLRCSKVITHVDRDGQDPVVPLPCMPDKHMYCSKSCFLVFALGRDISELKCPACGVEISEQMWKQHLVMAETSLRSASFSNESILINDQMRNDEKSQSGCILRSRICGKCSVF